MMRHPAHRSLLLLLALAILLTIPTAAAAQSDGAASILNTLSAASTTPVEVTWDSATGVPAFVSGRFPTRNDGDQLTVDAADIARQFLARHRSAWRMAKPLTELQPDRTDLDALGMSHVRLQQTYRGVPVLGAELIVHLAPGNRLVTAVNGDYLPDVQLADVKPTISTQQALAAARAALPGGTIHQAPHLVVVDGRLDAELSGAHLVWYLEIYHHDLPARNVYMIDAQTGVILQSYDRLATDRDRQTYTAEHRTVLPGTLWLMETGTVPGKSPSADGLNAHLFAGDTYQYFFDTHGRDSFDDFGASLLASVHYSVDFPNAFWNGSQMVYGDGFASANDVVAHELTHAVTEYTANLVYRFQSGALNESFSDIFGAMVDAEDWLMGEDLPIGAIRSLADPMAYGDPEHLDGYDPTCDDNGGVHTNSGIPNKVAYLLSESVGRSVAEDVFYRTLAYYLTSNAGFNDARSAAIQSAEDLFGGTSPEFVATVDAFADVGLDGLREPPIADCDCAATVAVLDQGLFGDATLAVDASITLYRLRDHVLRRTPAGQRYIDLYYQHTGELSQLLLKDPGLRRQAAQLLREALPGLRAMADGRGEKMLLAADTVAQLDDFLDALGVAAGTDSPLAKAVAAERERVDLDGLVGASYDAAWAAATLAVDGE